MRSKALITTVEEAIAAIPNGATIAVGGFVGAGHPEMLTAALERRFLQEGSPRDLTLFYCAGQGDRGERGLNHLAHPGCCIESSADIGISLRSWVPSPSPMKSRPTISPRECSRFCSGEDPKRRKRPGVFTKVGLNTFLDPVNGGGWLNARTTQDLVERIEIDGEIWLRYAALPIHVGLIRERAQMGREI